MQFTLKGELQYQFSVTLSVMSFLAKTHARELPGAMLKGARTFLSQVIHLEAVTFFDLPLGNRNVLHSGSQVGQKCNWIQLRFCITLFE